MDASQKLGIMHVRRPSIARGRFPVARCGQNLGVRHGLVVVGADIRIEIRKLNIFALGNRVDVNDVTRLPVTDFDAYCIRKDKV